MLGEKIVEHMKQFGQRPAIQINDTGDVYTFAQILQRVEYYRQQLILRQLPAGCVAAVSLENVVEYIAVLLALWQHDCIVVPMEECSAHALSQVQAKAGLDYLLCGEMRPGGAVLSESVYLIPQGGQAPNSTPAPIDAAVFLYTSGTTGLPKCVVFSHEAMYQKYRRSCSIAESGTVRCLLHASVAFDHLSAHHNLPAGSDQRRNGCYQKDLLTRSNEKCDQSL